MEKIDLELLNKVIEDLRNNPSACTLYTSNNQEGMLSLSESKPGEMLTAFIKYLYDCDFIDSNYMENDKKISEKEIDEMTFEEVLTRLTAIIRADRFCSGLLYARFKDGTLLKLVEKIVKLKNKYIKS